MPLTIIAANTAKITAVYKLLRKLRAMDESNVYILPEPVSFTITVRTPSWRGRLFTFEPRGDVTRVTLNAYGPGVCDGASWAPDGVPGAVSASAIHDPGYGEMDDIAANWKDEPFNPGLWNRDWITRRTAKGSDTWTPADVRQLFDDTFADAMARGGGGFLTSIYHRAVRLFGGFYHALALIAVAGIISGCGSLPGIVIFDEGLPEPVKVEPAPAEPAPDPQPPPVEETGIDAVDYSLLRWEYGGFNGSRATLDSPRLSNLTLRNGNRIHYRWDVGLDGWGLGRADAGALACVFFDRNGKWVGGKFDWVSTSRSDRELKHVQSYSNWPSSGITLPWGGKVAYVVVSPDGKRRSNVVVSEAKP